MTSTETMTEPAWTLGTTCRCLTEDLKLGAELCNVPITELADRADAHQVITDFVKKRSVHPIGSERINALLPTLIAYSLHSGRYRAATWHHEAAGIVWLLAAGWHEEGSADDAYPYFERLLGDGRILPTREDVEHVVYRRRFTFERALLTEAPRLRQFARDAAGVIQDGVIGGRIRVRVGFEQGDPGLLYVAITQRLLPGDVPLPAEWLIQVLAAFFPGVPLEDVDYVDEIVGRDLRLDEVGFCALTV